MTGKELIANLLQIISEADLDQEVYLKNGSEYTSIGSLKLDSDNGILVVVNEKAQVKMNYLQIGHDSVSGTCWYFKDKLLVKNHTNHSDWLDIQCFKIEDYACGRYDEKRKLISFVGISMSESRKEFIKKHLLQKFDGKIVEC